MSDGRGDLSQAQLGDVSRRGLSLAVVLLLLAATLVIGLAIKAPCATGDWADGRQYSRLCYSDIVPLLGTEHLQGDRLPYIDQCPKGSGQCDEYPVLTMYAMRAAASLSSGTVLGFYTANVVLLTLCAVAIAILLYLLVGARALFFVLAPTLAVYGFMNWDLIAVAFATGATYAYLCRRDGWAGVLIGLGTAAKLYPVLLLVPFAIGRFRDREHRRGLALLGGAAGSWLVVNLPFMLLAPKSWSEFFRFNAARPADWDSWWLIGAHLVNGSYDLLSVRQVNAASAGLFLVISAGLWAWKARREPGFPAWTFGLPLLVVFLLTNKVFSPQYSLWLLPWFALVLPDWRLFVPFELTNIAVFYTRFHFFGGDPFSHFEWAIGARTVVLLACLLAWVLRPSERVGEEAPMLPAASVA